MSKKKIILVVVLFSVAAALFGSYIFGGNGSTMKSVDSKTEAEAVNFCREIMQITKENNAREFIKRSVNPKDWALKGYFQEVQKCAEPENARWQVEAEAGELEIYHVRIMNADNCVMYMIIERIGGEWKFAGVPMG